PHLLLAGSQQTLAQTITLQVPQDQLSIFACSVSPAAGEQGAIRRKGDREHHSRNSLAWPCARYLARLIKRQLGAAAFHVPNAGRLVGAPAGQLLAVRRKSNAL